MAILYATSEPQAQRTLRRGRLHWCCFTITHEVNLTEKEIIKLHDSDVVMKVYNSRYRVAEKLLRLQPGIYTHENEEDVKKLFCPVYKVNSKPNVSHPKPTIRQSIVLDSKKTSDFVHTPLSDFEKEAGLLHRRRAEYIINYFLQHSNINAYISRLPFGIQHAPATGNLKENTPHQTRERHSPAGTNETYLELIKSDFSFPGEMIFTDRKELFFDMNTNKNMRGFILITVNNLLTPEQCNQLNPFLISISTIENVPVSILREEGFDRVYVQYETSLFGTVQTNTYPLKKVINIQESRSFLTHLKDKLKLINFAQSGHIIFQIEEEEECFLETKQLLECQTVLNITMSVASSLSKQLLTILSTNEPLSRIGLLIYDINVIIDLLTTIFEHNASLRTDNKDNIDVNMDCAKQQLSRNVSLKTEKAHQQFITGFYIDNGKTFYLFIEGSAAGFIHVIWSKIMNLTRKVALVWYNSDLVFTERLYSGMLPCLSVYGIVLKEPIEMLFRRSYTFLKGSMPIPCWEAVRKLNFLFMESTMLNSSKRGLFPTMEELISFDIEFGVPNKIFDPNIIYPSTSALLS
ncbi:uncharacterized protein LOC123305012 [Chrysoperla carnea]|uniref:uncharacterized protein LOC123305012 n=1 Tax=Chrysoperla carnea TaxID=189513 RepID=UPI001D07CC9C|nr:uncharacterized protein LOC123305012 [Chrysoperla carnea]